MFMLLMGLTYLPCATRKVLCFVTYLPCATRKLLCYPKSGNFASCFISQSSLLGTSIIASSLTGSKESSQLPSSNFILFVLEVIAANLDFKNICQSM